MFYSKPHTVTKLRYQLTCYDIHILIFNWSPMITERFEATYT